MSSQFPPEVRDSLAQVRFAELTEILLECSGVTLGRRFGRDCLKFGKRPFVVLDSFVLAFRVGPHADALHASFPLTTLWNQRHLRNPKLSWLACPPHETGALSTLTVAAFDWVRGRGAADNAAHSEPAPRAAAPPMGSDLPLDQHSR